MREVELIFLGTGGGRFAMLTQKRRTGGIRLIDENVNVHIDPGPGALIYSLKLGLNPQKVNAVLVTHGHPDHYANAELMTEAMTRGMTKRSGVLAASRSVLFGNNVCGPSISRYHQQKPSELIEMRPGTSFNIDDVTVMVQKAQHSDPDTVGLKMFFPEVGVISYTSDTEYFEGLGRAYKDSKVLILCAMRPSGSPFKGHMTTDDAIKIIEEAEPECAITTHFGMKMIFSGPSREARKIEEATGVRTISAYDGMRVKVGGKVEVMESKKVGKDLREYFKDGRT